MLKYYGENRYYAEMHKTKWPEEAENRYRNGKLPIDELSSFRGGELMARMVEFVERAAQLFHKGIEFEYTEETA